MDYWFSDNSRTISGGDQMAKKKEEQELKEAWNTFTDIIGWTIGTMIKGIMNIWKFIRGKRRQAKELKTKNDTASLINRLKTGARIDPQCKYADCLSGINNCSMLRECIVSVLLRCKK